MLTFYSLFVAARLFVETDTFGSRVRIRGAESGRLSATSSDPRGCGFVSGVPAPLTEQLLQTQVSRGLGELDDNI